ncbi:MAG: hypothetical protein A2268_06320 [Candidatus Raymondbacteria bacterium RifOxyA12_full_50_37]|uniref:Uncharacterized protein n=1 Tax=Candidatus Raymondbacteria bacterium RIFOXYD12_FULL_49_13 TaxID=1817890 RepID=A0A1F7FF81_UNCRA|nr:MAG: hypothetical protein A2268_06320 [Candidatus Raymondbacteria bacterium RifOxyA12_full_50_37]OGJ94426.1 MAG: hypothetical protein A2248_15250 [Candidatus Raymondbacteria bacterium RIFOXYA2_FULL_49_16]OGJ99182.1 MAG: hypothetical protein A2453_07100 [Candidatus Raymondbacteria bacterium RIFOXYC2_FULL_50_21]OGK01140.1 MAG: hypothetical protein A2350_10165 [Candidatus Raymondbacteria bacterium RifOxyB12_full_50_8]OGK05106.1 MAG: hypothetical protein A2519_13340 [Candidatus Raymondbacteria b
MRNANLFLALPVILVLTVCSEGIGKTIALPQWRNIKTVADTLMSGDTILCDSGIYQGFELTNLYDSLNPLIIKSKVLHGAQVIAGSKVSFYGARGVVFDGFEVRGPNVSTNSGLVHVSNNADYITIKNCHIHNAPLDADCIKANQAGHVNVIGCDLHDPGLRAAGNGPQETCDYLDIHGGVVRGNIFRWTTQVARQYFNAKGGSSDIILENNIFLNHQGGVGDPAVQLGGYSGAQYIDGGYEGVREIMRNNIVIASTTGGVSFINCNGGYVYNNLFINCVTNAIVGVATSVGTGSNGGNTDVYLFNNIFYNANGDMPRVMGGSTSILSNFYHGNNLYYNGGGNILAGFYNPNTETGRVMADPLITMLDSGSYESIINSLAIAVTSPAIDSGAIPDAVTPGVPLDIRGASRPLGSAYDIGPLEVNPTKAENGGRNTIQKDRIVVCPNPFNPVTAITLNAAIAGGQYTLEIYDIYGRHIDAFKTNGAVLKKGFVWNAYGYASGIYLITVYTGTQVFSDRLVMLK